ncbi:MAG: class I SAM-dependent methyltransferase [Promethearchaeota archaeon]|nr:MAG: class I SAM-dependent methyltransferase [Candidatus Lokiarchaeota archaeon]
MKKKIYFIRNSNKIKERIFWDRYSIGLRKNISKHSFLRRMKKSFWWENLIGKVKNKKIIDIGCGNRHYVTYWVLSGNEAVGIDISPETIENNKILHEKFGLKNCFSICSAEKLNFPSESFDIAHIQFLLHHLPLNFMDIVIKEAFRVLKEDGLLLLFEPNFNFPLRWIIQNPLIQEFNLLRKYAILKGWITPEEKALKNFQYIQLLKQNKFKIIKINYYKQTLSYVFKFFNKKIKKIGIKFQRFDRILNLILKPHIFGNQIQIISQK